MRAWLSVPTEQLVFTALDPTTADDGTVLLAYRVTRTDSASSTEETLTFTEQVTLPGEDVRGTPLPARILRLLSLAASLSYYKALVPATYSVPGGLTPSERHFLTEVIRGGLGEFAYRNDRPAALHPTIEAPELPEPATAPDAAADEPTRPLVAVGGGKDSIVTIEALRDAGVHQTLFSVNSYAPITATAEAAELDLLVARRRLDPLLFELNDAGALNGHVPVTAVNSLVGVLTALRTGHDAVVFSNEASSSFGNVHWEGTDVNHQWSKGIGFERLLVDALTGTGISYFSFLRPLTELAIMRQFARLVDYHPVFTSCNRAFHLDESKRRLWCGECPKCHFVFLCLAPFLGREDLLAIFSGRDLLADPAQHDGFLDLLNAGGRMKPFECVGEPDECRAALTMLSRHLDWAGHEFFSRAQVADCFVDDTVIESAFGFSRDHLLSPTYEKAARAVL